MGFYHTLSFNTITMKFFLAFVFTTLALASAQQDSHCKTINTNAAWPSWKK
jgi:hypothetical protein